MFIYLCVCCWGSVAAVLEHWQDKVGHGEAQAHRTAALQTALEGVGVSNRELAASIHGSTGRSLRHSYPTASLAHSENQLRRSWLSQGKHSPPYYLTYINPLPATSHYFVSWQFELSYYISIRILSCEFWQDYILIYLCFIQLPRNHLSLQF